MKIITHDNALGICEYIPAGKDNTVQLQPGIELVRGEPRALHFNMASYHLKHLMGEVLTILEATVENERQLIAAKSIIKNYFGRKIDWIYELCGMPEDGQEGLTEPEE